MSQPILICYGTRPETIKLSSVIKELTLRGIPFKTVFTGQHDDLFDDVSHLVPPPDYELGIMRHHQTLSDIGRRLFAALPSVIEEVQPSLMIVQGDTTTAAIGAIVAFYHRVPVGHVEAGLRTFDAEQPYPEEINRQMIARIARFNWAPTKTAAENLQKENVQNISITGNTIIDVCREYSHHNIYGDEVIVTLHRRENFGGLLRCLCRQLDILARQRPDLRFVFPMHPNPNVQAMKPLLRHVWVTHPFSYSTFLSRLAGARCVITDSGGLQEECAAFRKKVLVCRQITERPEGVIAGYARLVGDDIVSHFSWAADDPVWDGENPFGNGSARILIVNDIERFVRREEPAYADTSW